MRSTEHSCNAVTEVRGAFGVSIVEVIGHFLGAPTMFLPHHPQSRFIRYSRQMRWTFVAKPLVAPRAVP
eukprot:6379410-Prymnesium_polylepis.1